MPPHFLQQSIFIALWNKCSNFLLERFTMFGIKQLFQAALLKRISILRIVVTQERTTYEHAHNQLLHKIRCS